jgi:hypothetical protein
MSDKMIEKSIRENIAEARGRIANAARRSGRNPGDIVLVVVSKNRTVDEIQSVLAAGETQIGENRVQEAEKKRPALTGGFSYRMIGHLQRNKAATAVSFFDAIDSIDSLRIAERVSEETLKLEKIMPVLIQVNSSNEISKHGFEPNEIEKAADEIAKLEGLLLRGLMTIGPLTDDEGHIRRAFAETKMLFDKLRADREGFDILSMGMSDDYEMAIEEGSTMARIGRAVFERRI